MATQAELAKRYSQQLKGVKVQRQTNFLAPAQKFKPVSEAKTPQKNLFQKITSVGGQGLDIAGAIGATVGKFVVNTAIDVAKTAYGTVESGVEAFSQSAALRRMQSQQKQLDARQEQIFSDFKSGKMSKEDYKNHLQDLNQAYSGISKEARKISQDTSAQERAMQIVETGANLLSLGRFSMLSKGGKVAATLTKVDPKIARGVVKLEDAVAKIPAVRALVERNAAYTAKRGAQKLAGETIEQYLAREGRSVAYSLLLKRPLVYEMNIGEAREVYQDLVDKEFDQAIVSSAWLATQMLEGGPIGAFGKGLKWMSGKTGSLAMGRGSYIDQISQQIGDGNPAQIRRFLQSLQKKAPGEFKRAEKTFRILQETNLRAHNDDVVGAVESTLQHYTQHNIGLDTLTPGRIYRDMAKWAEADEILQRTIKSQLIKDVNPEDIRKYAVVRWDTLTKKSLADSLAKAGDGPQRLESLEQLANRPGVGWGNNEILMDKLRKIVTSDDSAEEIAKAIKRIPTASTLIPGVPKKIQGQLSKLGFSIAAPWGGRTTPVVDYEDTRKLITSTIRSADDTFDLALAPNVELNAVAGALTRAGLSPTSANKIANRKLAEGLTAKLDELELAGKLGFVVDGDSVKGGGVILRKLQNYIENKRSLLRWGKTNAITDMRQLRIGEIAEALSISDAEAKLVASAITDAHLKLPLEFRGLGDRIVDGLYKVNPLHRYYARVQSAMRYTYNPFFRLQEIVETRSLAHLKGGNLIWMKSRSQLDEASKQLEKWGIFTGTISGEAAQDQVLGRITANMTNIQKRDLAGLALKMSEVRGKSLSQMLTDNYEEIEDALRVIVQYPREGGISSPMARMLNLAFFPMRYNAKVTVLAAQEIAKLPPTTQLAVINSVLSFRDWLKSDEGIKWQSEHSDAIQVFNWITPVGSMQSALSLLSRGADTPGELGLLGGLPLGIITQVLDSQGIININRPYVRPDTGDVLPDYIPMTTQARAATALTEVLGTMFTYPGRILGLPGKEATLRDVVRAFIDTNGEDFEKRLNMDELSDLQRNWIRVLKGDTSEEAIDALYQSPAEGQFPWYTIPPIALPEVKTPESTLPRFKKRTGLPSSKRGKRAKNFAQPIPSA